MKHSADFSQATTDHIETKRKLKAIPRRSVFNEILDESTLNDEEKEIITLHYLKDKDFRYIGDFLGYSESTIKKKHKKALNKIQKII